MKAWNRSAQHLAHGPHATCGSFPCGPQSFLYCRKSCKSSTSNK